MKKIMMLASLLIITSISHMITATAVAAEENNSLCLKANKHCTFVLLSDHNNSLSSINGRANEPLSPFSTFKVANSLIALDTGVVSNAQQPLAFDKDKYSQQAWWPSVWKLPHYNLASAFKYSMVPIYRQIAMDIGQKQMQNYLTQFDYGNKDISSGLDDFWLNGSIKISAVEQVKFLQRLYHNQIKVKTESLTTLKEVMLVESTSDYKLYAKTGSGWVKETTSKQKQTAQKAMLGWYVGFVENTQGVHYFAFNVSRDSYAKMKKNRVAMAMNHLKAAGII
mgnify:CR=1 FL=1